jgi:hypothetical protein
MLDKARNNEFDKEKALLIFGEMYATAIAGDGAVGPKRVELAVGGELGGGAALLRLATLLLLKELLSDELKFDVRVYVRNDGIYDIAAYGEDAARFMRFLAVSAPLAGGEYLSPKFDEFVEEAKVEVRVDNIRETKSVDDTRGTKSVAADLTISEGGIEIKYNVYLRSDEIVLQFHSTDRRRVELAACLLRLVGVTAEVKKVNDEDVWYVVATTDKLAAGREELRKAIAEVVKRTRESIGEEKAERWLKKLEKGRVLMEGWPKFQVRLTNSGGIAVKFRSTDPHSIEQVAQRLREMGLKEDRHFTVKMPKDGSEGYISILKKGLTYAAWLSVYGSKTQRELAEAFIKLILLRAEEAGEEVHKKVEKIVNEGKSRRSQTLKDFKMEFEVNGRRYMVKVTDGEAVEENQNGKTLLKIKITVEVDRVEREYAITYSRHRKTNAALGRAYASAKTPWGKEVDAKIFSALIKTLTGKEPRVYQRSDDNIEIGCGREHLEGFMQYVELADDIEEWLEKTSRRAGSSTSQL